MRWQVDGSVASRSCIVFLDAENLIAVGPAEADISRIGGFTWRSLPGENGFDTFSIAAGNVWAAGGKGRFGRLQLSK